MNQRAHKKSASKEHIKRANTKNAVKEHIKRVHKKSAWKERIMERAHNGITGVHN